MKAEILAEGIGRGRALRLEEQRRDYARSIEPDQVDSELERFEAARTRALSNLQALIEKTKRDIGPDEAEIFEGHYELMESDDLRDEVTETIRTKLVSCEAAVEEFAESNAADMEALEDEYFQQRGQDLRDIGTQLIQELQLETSGKSGTPPEAEFAEDGVIIIAQELSPSQTAALDFSQVRGLVLARGGKNSHAAIIARSQDLPAIVLGDSEVFRGIKNGELLYVDADAGLLYRNPEAEKARELDALISQLQGYQDETRAARELPSRTADGHPLGLFANVGGTRDICDAAENCADGIGLFRTEFLFMEGAQPPTEQEQARVYQEALEKLPGKTVIIRLLDTGADKPLPYLKLTHEENPFLGIRGIRLLLDHPEYLRSQLRALLQASAKGNLHVMIPMVDSIDPIRRVKEILHQEDPDWSQGLKLGVMVETPAAVILIEEILDEVEFISIGTNDLTQYTLAADRGNPDLARYYDEFHPAVLRSIAKVVESANRRGILNGVCGELAGNPLALPFFVGIGVQELSSSPKRIGQLKLLLQGIHKSQAESLSQQVLGMSDSEKIRHTLEDFTEQGKHKPRS